MKDFEMTVPMQDSAGAAMAAVAIDAALTAPGARAYILHDAAAGDLPAGLHPASLGGEAAEAVRVAAEEADLAALVAAGRAEAIDLPAEPEARAALFAKWARRAARKHRKALVPMLLLPLAACGGGDDDDPQHVSRAVDTTDSGTTVTITGADGGATVTVNSLTPAAETVTNLEVDADGEGTLTIAFDDADDTLVLSAASDITGFTRIEVLRGTVDFTAVTLPAGLTIVSINSGAIFTHAQFMAIPAIESQSGHGGVTVIVATVAEALDVAGAKAKIDGAALHIDIDRESDAAAVLDVGEAAQVGAHLVDGYRLSDSLADLSAAGDAVLAGAEGVVLTDTGTVSAADLSALDARLSVTVDATSVTAITGTLDDALAALQSAGLGLAADIAVTVTGAALDADDLAALDALTTGTITLTGVESVSGSHAAITAIIDSDEIDTDPDPTGIDVTVTDTITAAQANAIATGGDIGDGTVTATLAADTVQALNGALTDADENAYTITITDTAPGFAALQALNELDGKTSVAIDAASVTALTDTGAPDAAAFVTAAEAAYGSAGITGLGDEPITMVSFDVTVAEAVRLAGLTSARVSADIRDSAGNLADASDAQFGLVTGTVTADTEATAREAVTLQAFTTPVAYDIEDDADSLMSAIGDDGTAFLNDAHRVRVTGSDAEATEAALATTILGASNSGTTWIEEVTGTVTQILALPIGATDSINVVTVTGTVTAAQAAQLDDLEARDNITIVSYDSIPVTADGTVTVAEDGTYTFSADDFAFDDADGGSLASVVIQAAPAAGTLALSGTALDFSGGPVTVAAADIANLTFAPAADENGAGYASIVFTVVDDEGTASDVATITVDVTSVMETIDAAGASAGMLQTWAAGIDDIASITNLTLTIDPATAATGRGQVFAEVSDAEAEALFTKATGGVTITGNAGADWIDLRGLDTSGVDFTVNALDGDNVIYAGDGDDSITTGAGADYIEVGNGADTVVAGGGDDVIAVRALHNTNGSSYDGGTGTDTLRVYGVNDLSGSTLTSIETLEMLPGSPSRVTMTVEQVAALDTITGAETGSELVIVEADGGATTVDLSGTAITGLGTLTAGPGVTVTVGVTQLAEIGELVTEGDGEIEITDLDTGAALDGDVDLSGADLGTATINLDVNGQTLTLTAEQADGATLTGTGAVRIIGSATYDDTALTLAGVAEGLTVTFVAAAGATVDVTANTWFDANDGTTDRIDGFEIEEGATLTIASDQAYDGGGAKQITGTGILIVELGSDAFDLSGIAITVLASATVSADATLNAGAALGSLAVTVAEAATFTLTAAQADGAVIGGAGGVSVTDLDQTADADLSGITATGNLTAEVDGDVTFTGDLGGFSVTVAENATLTLSAAQATGRAITGAEATGGGNTGGSVVITGLDSDANDDGTADTVYDFAAIEAGGDGGAGTAGSVTLSVTADDRLEATTVLGGAVVTVAAGVTLTLTAAQADGRTITGEGNVTITDLDQAAAADLSGITATGTKTVEVGQTVTFTGDLGEFAVTVAENATLVLQAAQATGRTITGAEATDEGTGGSVTITALDTGGATDYDFAAIAAGAVGAGTAGVVQAMVGTDTVLNAATDLGTAQVVIYGGSTLTLTAAQAHEQTIIASPPDGGAVVITGYDGFLGTPDPIDLAGLDDALDVTLQLAMTDDRSLSDDYSQVDTLAISGAHVATIQADATVHAGLTISLAGGATLELGAADAAALAGVTGEGTVTVQTLEDAPDADLTTLSGVTGTVTAYLSTAGGAVVDVSADLSAVDLLQVTGTGTARIVAGTGEDPDAEVGEGTLSIDVGADATLEIGAADAAALAGVTGAGTVEVTGLEDAPDADLSNVGEAASFGQMVYAGLAAVYTPGNIDNIGYTINGVSGSLGSYPDTPGGFANAIEADLNGFHGAGRFDVRIENGDLIIEALVAGQVFNSGIFFNNTGPGSPSTITPDITQASPGTIVTVTMEMTADTVVSANLITADTLTVSSDGDAADGPFTATLDGATLHPDLVITVTDGSTLSLDAADAGAVAGVTAASGTIAVTALEATPGTDLSTVTGASVTAEIASASDPTILAAAHLGSAVVTITGSGTVTVANGATIDQAAFVIAENATLTLSAAQASGLSVTEADPGGVSAGTVAVTALDDTPAADLSGLTVTTVTALVALSNETVSFTGDLGQAAVSITGVAGGSADIFDVTNATMGTATFDVGANAYLRGSAAKLDGVQASGAGIVNLTATSFAADTDLSGIATATLWFDGNATNSLTVSAGTLTIRQAHLATIGDDGVDDITGAGNVTVTEVTGLVNLSEIGVSGTVTADIIGDVSFEAGPNLDAVDVFLVGAGESLTIDAGKANGKTITATGDGRVTITGADATVAYDFDAITAETPVTIEIETGGILNENIRTVEDQAIILTVAANQTLTLSAASADGVTITGLDAGAADDTGGSVVITTLDGAQGYDLSAVMAGGAGGGGTAGTVTATITSSTALHTGTLLGAVALTVNAGQTLTLTGAQATGRDIGGPGNLVVTAFAGDTDLSQVAVAGTVTGRVDGGDADVSANASVNAGDVDAFVVTTGNTLTLDAALFVSAGAEVTVSGDGAVVVSGATVGTAYDFSDITATGTVRVAFTDHGTVNAATVLTGVDELSLAAGGTTTLTQAQADGIAFTGGGPVEITAVAGAQTLQGTALDDIFHADDDAGTIDLLDISQGGSDTLVFTTAANGFLVTGFNLGAVGAGQDGDVIDLSGAGLGLRNEHASSDAGIDFQYYANTNTDLTGEVIVFTELLAGSAASIATVFNFTIEGVRINDLIDADANAADGSDLLFVIANDADNAVNIWRWQDTGPTGSNANDGDVQAEELTLVATLDGVTLSDLPNLDSSNLIT